MKLPIVKLNLRMGKMEVEVRDGSFYAYHRFTFWQRLWMLLRPRLLVRVYPAGVRPPVDARLA